jgi:dTDP-4-amino-4,6-dideoxygalactose transaminase
VRAGSDVGNEGTRQIQIASPTLPDLDALLPRLREIWASGELTNGRLVAEFERCVAATMPGREIIAVNSCTSGLMLALRALEVGGEVLLPSFTFTATAHAVSWNGCKPVFVDCDADTLNIDLEDLQRKITSRTGAIVAVYVSGNPPALGALQEIATQRGLKLVLDAAHALGSTYQRKTAGTFGDAEVFSLSPTKTITTCEGGIVSVRDPEIARRLRIGRNYANPGNYDCEFVGLNARMSELHALVGLESFRMLGQNVQERRRLAALYQQRLEPLRGLELQRIGAQSECSFKDFSLETRTYFDPPVHRQSAYVALEPHGTPPLPTTDRVAREILNLPLYVGLQEGEVDRIVRVIEGASKRTAVEV